MPEKSRQVKRRQVKLKAKQVATQLKILKTPLTKGEYIRHARQLEQSISIIHNFLKTKFGEEYSEFLDSLSESDLADNSSTDTQKKDQENTNE